MTAGRFEHFRFNKCESSKPLPVTTQNSKRKLLDGSLAEKKPQKRRSRGYADPSVYAALPQTVPDSIREGLTLLIVGLNPGIMTAKLGLHFANPTNLFWPLLYSSGIITRPMKAQEGCQCLVEEFNVGITNVIERPTAEGGELAKCEYGAGVSKLEDKVRRYRPQAMTCSGKGIWEAVFRHIHGRSMRKSDNFQFGWQKDSWALCEDGYKCAIFVTMGTSGRVAAYSPAYKRRIFNELGQWVQATRSCPEQEIRGSQEFVIQAKSSSDIFERHD